MNQSLLRDVIRAARRGYQGQLPGEPCATCGGVVRVHTSKRLPGGWVVRYMACEQCERATKFQTSPS